MMHLFKVILIAPIKAYQYLLSPWLGHWCRFTPSCSHYAIEAITHRGPVVGLFLAFKRVFRCHPWCQGGHDPVPASRSGKNALTRADSASQHRNHTD
jgi:putative membrane protein insertion efficiency factor